MYNGLNDEESISDEELVRRARLISPERKVDSIQANLGSNDAAVRLAQRSILVARMNDVSLFMKELKQRFTAWYNRTHEREGALWNERFKSVIVEDDPSTLLAVAAYIDLNQVRAGLVDDPGSYRFCGYAEALGGSRLARSGLAAIAATLIWSEAIACYRAVIFGGETCPNGTAKSEAGLAINQKAPNKPIVLSVDEALPRRLKYFTHGVAVGSKTFAQKVLEDHQDRFACRRLRRGPVEVEEIDWREMLFCLSSIRNTVYGNR